MKKLVVIIAGGLLATVIVAGVFWLKIRDESAQTDLLQSRITALETAPRPVAAPAVQAPPVMAPIPEKPAAAAPVAAAQPKPAAAPAGKSLAAQTRELIDSPAGNQMLRALLLQQYPNLAREMDLSEAEASRLMDVLARQQLDLTEDSMALLGGGPSDPNAMQQVQRKLDEKMRAHETELAGVLGDKYASWQQYQATSAARQQITRLQTALGSTNPLSESQSKALLVSMTAAQSQLMAERRNQPAMSGGNPKEMLESQIKAAEENMRQLLRVASPHLTVAQLEAYKNAQEQDISMLRTIMGSLANAP